MGGAYESAKLVEARSLRAIGPFLESTDGRFVLTDKGRLARFLQETCGDLMYNDRRGRLWVVECKAEKEWTGNLFLEEWSNRNLEDPDSHAYRGSTVGWLRRVRADLLFYHFLDTDTLWVINMFSLQRWAFRSPSKKRGERANRLRPEAMTGRIYDFPMRQQAKYDQLNDTWGYIVPVEVLDREMEKPPRAFEVEQLRLGLLDESAA